MAELQADTVIKNANVITVDPKLPRAQALAIRDDRFVAVGGNGNGDVSGVVGSGTRVLDLGGKTVVPGLIDAHNHMLSYALGLRFIDFHRPPVSCIADIVQRIGEKAGTQVPGTWIQGRGYDQNMLSEGRHPTRWELDSAAPHHPVLITQTSGHMGVANTSALALARITKDTPDPEGGRIERDERGEATGLLLETAQDLVQGVLPKPSFEEIGDALALVNQRYLEEGLTGSHDAGVGMTDPREIRAFQTAVEEGVLKVRTNLMVALTSIVDMDALGEGTEELSLGLGLRSGLGDELLRLGPLKVFVDGAITGRTAAFEDPYTSDPEKKNLGMLVTDESKLRTIVRAAHKVGWQLAIHAIGDRAIRVTVDAIEAALKEYPKANHRHRIEHCGILNPQLVQRIRELGVVPCTQPTFIWELGDSFIANIGRERCRMAYPFRSLLDAGIVLAGGSDRPVVNGNPMLGIHTAVNETTAKDTDFSPGERLTPEEAIRLYTWNAAYASFEEGRKGSIKTGKLADLVVLSEDPTRVDALSIKDIKVVATMVGGEFVYEQTS